MEIQSLSEATSSPQKRPPNTNGKTPRFADDVVLEVKRLTKRYEETLAVDNVSLQVRRGEIFALLGGSGSGKSTLLRMLAGFETPSGGRIMLDGKNITAMPPHKRPINMMFQSYALFPHMSVAQNIAFGLKQDKLAKGDIEARVEQMLKLVHMERFAKRKPHQLSGGQRQRVALARSLAKRPKLLLLDEPMAALDKKLRTEMQLEVVEIIEQVGVTCIMVTHDQEEAMTMADRVAIMADGWIEQVGSPSDIYESPANRMVAEFVGTVNLFEGELVEDASDHCRIVSPMLQRPIYIDRGVTTQADERRVWAAIRPEKIQLTRVQPPGEVNWESGVVEDIAYLGGFSLYYIRTPSGQLIKVAMANTERRGDRPTWEEPVFVHWPNHSAIVLNQ
ncbi:polyamine ABC transporter ATP-binding protein [Halomonas sp. Bachu 37]|uniref:ABC transporter ATP-binding protein n=1 Tax=Halomonas kashgarensis TaxID=3084920 RepID=UPI003216AB35